MSPVRRSKNRFNTPQQIVNLSEPFPALVRVVPGTPRSQHLMTFIVNPSHRAPVVGQVAAVKVLLAVLAMIVNHLDLDFGGGRRFPRVSPAALLLGQGAPLDPGAGNLFEFSGGVTYQPTNEPRMQLNYVKNRLVRKDTGLVAFDTNIFTLRTTYQFTKFSFARAIIDYNTLNQRVREQFLYGWTPNPGTAFYAGYNDDLNYGFNAISSSIIPGFRRNGRTFFVKMSYLFRKSF